MGHGGQYHVHEAPRGYAKSTTVSLALPLAVLGLSGIAAKLPYKVVKKNYVWLVSDTAPQAKMGMESILDETESNRMIRRWFPHLTPGVGRHGRPLADRDDDVIFHSRARLQALSSGMKLRGRRHRQYRPDLCLVDDLENDEAVLTEYQRNKLDSWFSKSLLPALAKGADLHYLGTPLHQDGQLYRLKDRAGFRFHRYEALRDQRVPCPDHGWHVDGDSWLNDECDLCMGSNEVQVSSWSYRDHYWHATQRATMGSRAYTQEVLLMPIDEENAMFKQAWLRYRVKADSKVDLPDGYRVRVVIDPASGEAATNDFSAITVIGRAEGQREFDVLDGWWGKQRGAAVKGKAVEMWEKWGGIMLFEDVQLQAWAKQEMEDTGIPVRGVKPGKRNKTVRGEAASVHYEMGRVWHAPHLKDTEFETQLLGFGQGAKNDDCPDTLFYGIEDLEHEPGGGVAGVVQHDGPAVRRAAEREKAQSKSKPAQDDTLSSMLERFLVRGESLPWENLAVADADRLATLCAEHLAVCEAGSAEAAGIAAELDRRPRDLPSGVNDPRFG
jgi:hypothetical protein